MLDTDSRLRMSVELCPEPADLALLEAKVAEAAVAAAGVDGEEELAVFIRHPDGTVAAGLCGTLVGGCLDLQAMWVDGSLRGRGLARELFTYAETEAGRRGCRTVTLLAYDVCTGRMFERMGYHAAGVIETAFAGTAVRWYCKELAGSPAPGVRADEHHRGEASEAGRPDHD